MKPPGRGLSAGLPRKRASAGGRPGETREESRTDGVKETAARGHEPPDEDVVREVLAGNRDRFEILVSRYQERVYRLVVGMVRDTAHADDLVQEVFVKAYTRLPEFARKSRFYTWLYRIAVNRTLDFLKVRKRERRTLPLEEAVSPAPRPLGSLLAEEFRAQVEAALAALPPKFRQILVLREVEGLSYEEIARVLGCSKGTVESRLFRARARLREKLKAYCR